MNRLLSFIGVLTWFIGGTLLALEEVLALPSDPFYSTLLQLLPLIFLAGGIWLVIFQYQQLKTRHDDSSNLLKEIMDAGWIAVFAVNAGLASLNNFSTIIFHFQLPYYFQGVSLAQKAIALVGVFVLGAAALLSSLQNYPTDEHRHVDERTEVREKPLTNIGFILLLSGVVIGLAQYWSQVIFAGFLLLLAGAMLFLIGSLTERQQ